jgi:hypothetical protein
MKRLFLYLSAFVALMHKLCWLELEMAGASGTPVPLDEDDLMSAADLYKRLGDQLPESAYDIIRQAVELQREGELEASRLEYDRLSSIPMAEEVRALLAQLIKPNLDKIK